jgi:hypothetical protein
MFRDRKAFRYLEGERNAVAAKLSPNGQWVAYQADQAGRCEIFVQTFPKPGGKWQISTSGRPVWSRDGKELYFISEDQKMMAAQIIDGSTFDHGVPKPLFDVHVEATAKFDVGKNGKLLMLPRLEQAAAVTLTVVLNWTAGLKK